MRLRMFNAVEPIEEGHLIVTEGGRYAPAVVVGSVAATATAEAGFSLIADVTPAVDFSRIDFVKVLVGWLPGEFTGPAEIGDPIPDAPDPFPGT